MEPFPKRLKMRFQKTGGIKFLELEISFFNKIWPVVFYQAGSTSKDGLVERKGFRLALFIWPGAPYNNLCIYPLGLKLPGASIGKCAHFSGHLNPYRLTDSFGCDTQLYMQNIRFVPGTGKPAYIIIF